MKTSLPFVVSVLLVVASLAVPAAATVLPTVSSGTLRIHLSADTDVTTSGSAVTAWNDTANSVSFTPLIGTSPTLVPNAMNGKPVVRFNGTSDALQWNAGGAVSGLSDNFTLFIVTQNATNPRGAFESHPGGGNTARFFGDNEFELWNNNPDAPVTLHATGSVVAIRADTSPGRSLDILEFSSFGSVTTSDSSASTTAISWANPAIGEIFNNNSWYGGDIAELVVYEDYLSDSDRNAVVHALALSYGLIPEPSALALASFGLVGLAFVRRRRRECRG